MLNIFDENQAKEETDEEKEAETPAVPKPVPSPAFQDFKYNWLSNLQVGSRSCAGRMPEISLPIYVAEGSDPEAPVVAMWGDGLHHIPQREDQGFQD